MAGATAGEGAAPDAPSRGRPDAPLSHDAARLAALGGVVPALAHDLGNALTGVLGCARLLAAASLGERQRLQLERLIREAERARALVDDVGAIARGGRADGAPASLDGAAREAVRLAAGELLASGIDLVEDLSRPAPPVAAPHADLALLVHALVRSAARPLEGGRPVARIVVSAGALPGEGAASLTVAAEARGAPSELPGGAAAPPSRAFAPSAPSTPSGATPPAAPSGPSTPPAASGAAGDLDAAVAALLAERLGARLVRTRGADGAPTVSVALPAAPVPGAGATERAPARSAPPAAPPRRALVVDDEPALAETVGDSLRALGFDALVVHDGARGLDLLLEGEFDLVVVDLQMPGTCGARMCEALRQRRPEMLRRVIVASGDASLARHRASLDDLGVAVIEKPFRADRLAAAARDVVRRADEAAPRTPAEGVKAVRAAGTPAAAAPGGG